jgi:hypothetical protein
MRTPKANPNQPLLRMGYRQPRNVGKNGFVQGGLRPMSQVMEGTKEIFERGVRPMFRDNWHWFAAAPFVLLFVLLTAANRVGEREAEVTVVSPNTVSLSQACMGSSYEPPRVIQRSNYADIVIFKNITTSMVDSSHQHVVERACKWSDNTRSSVEVVSRLNNGGIVRFWFQVVQYSNGNLHVSGARQSPTLGKNMRVTYPIADLHL